MPGTLLAGGTAAHAATGGDNCGTNADWGYYNCMYIGDGIIRGWAHQTDSSKLGATVHEEVTRNGNLVCNSSTTTHIGTSQVISCQISGSPVAGTYSSIVWVYNPDWAKTDTPEYYNGGENCLDIS